jgi:hypothetical protein
MSIRWPYCREYQVNPDHTKEQYSESYNSKTKKNERTRLYSPLYTYGVQEQYDMDQTVKKVCNVVFAMLAIGAIVGIGYAIHIKNKI